MGVHRFHPPALHRFSHTVSAASNQVTAATISIKNYSLKVKIIKTEHSAAV